MPDYKAQWYRHFTRLPLRGQHRSCPALLEGLGRTGFPFHPLWGHLNVRHKETMGRALRQLPYVGVTALLRV